MEVVYSGIEIKKVIDKKIRYYENKLDELSELIETLNEKYRSQLKEYESKSFFGKLFSKKPRRRNKQYDDLFYHMTPEDQVFHLELKIEKLKKMKSSIKDDSQVILNSNELLYYDLI